MPTSATATCRSACRRPGRATSRRRRRPAGRCFTTPTTARSSPASTPREPDPLIPPHDATIGAIPTWSTLKVGTGAAPTRRRHPPSQISNFRPDALPALRRVRTSLTWTPRAGRATDLVYDVIAARNSPHVGAVRRRSRRSRAGRPTVTDVIDGAGARRGHSDRWWRRHRRADRSTSRSEPTTGNGRARLPRRWSHQQWQPTLVLEHRHGAEPPPGPRRLTFDAPQ